MQKLDAQTGSKPQGGASFEGITFSIINDGDNDVTVDASPTPRVRSSRPSLPIPRLRVDHRRLPAFGKYIIRETSSNGGYLSPPRTSTPVTPPRDIESPYSPFRQQGPGPAQRRSPGSHVSSFFPFCIVSKPLASHDIPKWETTSRREGSLRNDCILGGFHLPPADQFLPTV